MSIFKLEFEVRDNEVDIEGIVNNANYFIYLSHTRHKWANFVGLNFTEWFKNGQAFVVLSSFVNYKDSLKPDDKFYVTCEPRSQESSIKFDLYQEIRLCETNKLILTAVFTATCINKHATNRREKLYIPEAIKSLINNSVTN